jgi:hypothetical protein
MSSIFEEITVITSKSGNYQALPNVKVINLNWDSHEKYSNVYYFLKNFIPLLRKRFILFSHMTEVQSALVAPLTRLLGIKHYLWYAHKSSSLYLRWCNFWVDAIITSTPGSCPLISPKVLHIGQAIDPVQFEFCPPASFETFNTIHYGRFDPSKNLGLICGVCKKLASQNLNIRFTQIGVPSNPEAERSAAELKLKFSAEIASGLIRFRPSMVRSEIPSVIREFNLFVHAFEGSLDKTLIEATMAGLPVATINLEYLKIFGSWNTQKEVDLESEILSIAQLSIHQLRDELIRRRIIAEDKHSLEKWLSKLELILRQDPA